MDFTNIKKVANSLSKLIDDSEKTLLPAFASKLAKASELYPEDQTIGGMADITARMVSNKKLFISRAEVRDLYTRLYSRNSKFAELFADELGQVEKVAAPATYKRDTGEDVNLAKYNDRVVDPTLATALNAMFGTKTKGYSEAAAENAKAVCMRECASIKLASKVDVSNGNADVIVCRATFETPKGPTSVFIPVELTAGKALMPSIFVGNNGPENFSQSNIKKYIVANAGQKLAVNDEIMFAAIQSAKGDDISKISSVDLVVTKMNAEKETKADYTANGIYFQKLDAEEKNLVVKTAMYKDNEIDTFASAFDTSVGIAKFKFGVEKINLGRTIISNKLAMMGQKNHQVVVAKCDDKCITYAVSLNAGRVAFNVPVDVVDGKLLDPTLVISNGSIESFSKDGISNLFKKEAIDYKTAAVASPLYGLKASELVQTVRESIAEENYAKAEDALNILATSGDDKAYKTAFALYSSGLSGTKVAKVEHGCNMVVQSPSSKHALCGHTGLPLHKVAQDKHGNCIPSYRQGMNDTREGAYFMNSKIFF